MSEVRESYPNPERPKYWPGKEDHYRSELDIGDTVRMEYGALGRISCFNNTWSHIRGGRLVHLESILSFEVEPPEGCKQFGHNLSWEDKLTLAQAGDISAHMALREGMTWGSPNSWNYIPASWEDNNTNVKGENQ